MPTYVYRREDGTTFEYEQRIIDDALSTCPTTGQKVSRVITGGTGLIFKGNGFYLTDYVRKNSSPPASEPSSSTKPSPSDEASSSDNKSSTTASTEKKSD